MNFTEFRTTDLALSRFTKKHALEFSCHVGTVGYWKNIHDMAVLKLIYDGNSYRAFYDADYFIKGVDIKNKSAL
jgi:hypothetical protein